MTTIAVMTPEQRRATTEALKIARSADRGRPVLRSLILSEDHGYVTDSYRAVRLDWIDATDEPTSWDAEALYGALKGAGKDWARLDVDGDVMTVVRFEPPYGLADTEEFVREAVPGPGVDVTYVARVEFEPPKIGQIMDDAIVRTQHAGYVPEPAPMNGDFLGSLAKCHPNAFGRGANANTITVKPCGLKPAVIENGHPYAILMPVRVH